MSGDYKKLNYIPDLKIFLENGTDMVQEPQENGCCSLQIKLLATAIQDIAIQAVLLQHA